MKLQRDNVVIIIFLIIALTLGGACGYFVAQTTNNTTTNSKPITPAYEYSNYIDNSEWLEIFISKDLNPKVFYDNNGDFHVRYDNKMLVIK